MAQVIIFLWNVLQNGQNISVKAFDYLKLPTIQVCKIYVKLFQKPNNPTIKEVAFFLFEINKSILRGK